MPRYSMPAERHAKIFGPPSLEETKPGRTRRCKSCGGWHRLDAWPHNCRKPQDTPQQVLAAPQLAPSFEPFRTGVLKGSEVIGSRNDKREYMKRNDLVEHEEGVGAKNQWVEDHETRRDIVNDLKRFHETDSENLSPDLKAQRFEEGGVIDKQESPEIAVDDIPVIKDVENQ